MDSVTGAGAPVLLGIDWGSSNLRVALVDAQGRVLERRESPAGVFAVREGEFAAALWALCADWVGQHGLPLLACGMIGSRQGIIEAPYVACPATAADLARSLVRVELNVPGASTASEASPLFIVPGLVTGSEASGHDVLRGEETQLLGIDAVPGSLFVLPGTHSKWILRGEGASVDAFQTYMTGELFDLLTKHGSLARVMSAARPSPQAFEVGVCEARDGALEDLLFRVRTAGLMGRFEASALGDYLSGLLIGAELKAGLRRFASSDTGAALCVLGTPQLTQRYAVAMRAFARAASELSGDSVFAGLLLIAGAAGLLGNRLSSS